MNLFLIVCLHILSRFVSQCFSSLRCDCSGSISVRADALTEKKFRGWHVAIRNVQDKKKSVYVCVCVCVCVCVRERERERESNKKQQQQKTNKQKNDTPPHKKKKLLFGFRKFKSWHLSHFSAKLFVNILVEVHFFAFLFFSVLYSLFFPLFHSLSIYLSMGGARGVVVIAVGNEHGDTSSNPGRYWLHFT